MSSDASIAQGNREIAGFKTFQNDACIDDRTVALGAIQRVAERLRGSGNVVEQPDTPEVRVARQSEAEEWIVHCFGGKLQKPDLARNADAHVFVVYLTGRQTGASQQRFEVNARLSAGVLPPIVSPRPVRPAASPDARTLLRFSSRGWDWPCASERLPTTAGMSKSVAANNKTPLPAT